MLEKESILNDQDQTPSHVMERLTEEPPVPLHSLLHLFVMASHPSTYKTWLQVNKACARAVLSILWKDATYVIGLESFLRKGAFYDVGSRILMPSLNSIIDKMLNSQSLSFPYGRFIKCIRIYLDSLHPDRSVTDYEMKSIQKELLINLLARRDLLNLKTINVKVSAVIKPQNYNPRFAGSDLVVAAYTEVRNALEAIINVLPVGVDFQLDLSNQVSFSNGYSTFLFFY